MTGRPIPSMKAWPRIREAAVSTGVSLQGQPLEGDGDKGMLAFHKDDWRSLHAFGRALIAKPTR